MIFQLLLLKSQNSLEKQLFSSLLKELEKRKAVENGLRACGFCVHKKAAYVYQQLARS
jgi:hypothetical protein